MNSAGRTPNLNFRLRRAWQRHATRLPVATAPWRELFGDGVCATVADGSGRAGILHREAGAPFTLEPVQYHGTPVRVMPDDRVYHVQEPERTAYWLRDAAVYTQNGVVYDPHSRLVVAETLEFHEANPARHPMFAAPQFPACRRLPGQSFLFGRHGADTFYHFLVEALPALLFARDFVLQCDHVLVPDGGRKWKLRWLTLAGVAPEQIEWLPELAHVRCERLIFTSRVVHHVEPNPWAIRMLRAFLPPRAVEPAAGARAFWLDRSHMPARRVAWEPALIERLSLFEPVRLDSLDPAAGADLLAAARTLAGFHGAAFANMIFRSPGARIVEILVGPNYPWYARLAQVCGHEHTALVVDDSPASLERLARDLPALLT